MRPRESQRRQNAARIRAQARQTAGLKFFQRGDAMTRIRFRSDSWHIAELKSRGIEYSYDRTGVSREAWVATPEAQPGDCWRVRWHSPDGQGAIAGYALCCPGCRQVHPWTTATNCAGRYETSYAGQNGQLHKSMTCPHSGTGSCWQWTGSAEDGTLTAMPSLWASGACGWHGWLTNGEMRPC
jgi:hypothetical protein